MASGLPEDFKVVYYAIDLLSKNSLNLAQKINLNTLSLNMIQSQLNQITHIQSNLIKLIGQIETDKYIET